MHMETSREILHPIKSVARRTGLSTHVIRAWEKRYGALAPQRTGSNRRLYTEADIERLSLLRRATTGGHSISQIARLSVEELQGLVVVDESSPTARTHRREQETQSSLEFHILECLAAVRDFDGERLDLLLRRAAIAVSQPVLLEGIIRPLLERIGDHWATGELRVAHEHMATAIVRNFLSSIAAAHQPPENAPVIMIGTPTGQIHELGAVLSAVAALSSGWRVVYLGTEVPVQEFIHVAQRSNCSAIGLSLVYPPDDPRLIEELSKLRQMLPTQVKVIIGGRSARSYAARLREQDVACVGSLPELIDVLNELRQNGAN